MKMKETVMDAARAMDRIILRPHMSLGISTQNKKTGEVTGPKSVHFSICTTLLRATLALLAFFFAIHAMMCFCRVKRAWHFKKKLRAKMRRRKKK